MTSFTDDDIGKTVRTPDGETIGQIAAVEEGRAYVETDPGLLDSVKATLGLGGDPEGTLAVDRGDVAEMTDDAVRVPAEDLRGGVGESVADRDEGTGQYDVDTPTDAGDEGDDARETTDDHGDDRHSDMDDAPPEGDRTVTEKRGENESERD